MEPTPGASPRPHETPSPHLAEATSGATNTAERELLPFTPEEAQSLLSYSDVLKGEDLTLAQATMEHNPSANKYAARLVELSGFYGRGAIFDRALDIKNEFDEKAAALGLEPAKPSKSISWAVWDIAKQSYLSAYKSESNEDHYELADPMLDDELSVKVRKQMVDRQLGWEYERAIKANPDFKPLVPAEDQAAIAHFFDSAAKHPDGTLRSFALADVGWYLSESLPKASADEEPTEPVIEPTPTPEPAQSNRRVITGVVTPGVETPVAPNPGRVGRRVSTDIVTPDAIEPTVPPIQPETPTLEADPEKKKTSGNFLKRVGRIALGTIDSIKIIRQVGMKNFLRDRFEAAKDSLYTKTEARLWKIADSFNRVADEMKSEYKGYEAKIQSVGEIYRSSIIQLGEGINETMNMWLYKRDEAKKARETRIKDRVTRIKSDVRARRLQNNPSLGRPAL